MMIRPEFHLLSSGKLSVFDFLKVAVDVAPVVTAIHLREKTWTAAELWQAICRLQEARVPVSKLYINDRVDVGWAAGLAGVHLAYHSLPPAIVKEHFPGLRVGRSVHSLSDAKEMEEQGADYLFFGHIYASNSKPGLDPRGLDKLAEVARQVNIPVVAIGGLTPGNAGEVMAAGAAGIAVISGLVEAADPLAEARRYLAAMQRD